MKIVIAGDKKFKKFVVNAKLTTEQLGYDTLIYDLGGLGIGKLFDGKVSDIPLQTIPCKPEILIDALTHYPDEDFFVWLDADAIIRTRIDEIKDDDYDIGVTVRSKPAGDPRVSMINAGIIFLKNTTKTKVFLDIWNNRTKELNGDQWALNQLLEITESDKNKILIKHDTKVKTFLCETYNNFMFKIDPPESAKIIHYKSKKRHLYPFGEQL